MSSLALLYPVFVMVFLTLLVALWLLKCRYRAVMEGLNPRYFRHNRGAKIPDYLDQATQHYENLYEMPILFYAAVGLALASNLADTVLIGLAWGFVLSRLIHSWIHLTQNKILHRRNIFLVSFVFLLLMWVWFFIRVISTSV